METTETTNKWPRARIARWMIGTILVLLALAYVVVVVCLQDGLVILGSIVNALFTFCFLGLIFTAIFAALPKQKREENESFSVLLAVCLLIIAAGWIWCAAIPRFIDGHFVRGIAIAAPWSEVAYANELPLHLEWSEKIYHSSGKRLVVAIKIPLEYDEDNKAAITALAEQGYLNKEFVNRHIQLVWIAGAQMRAHIYQAIASTLVIHVGKYREIRGVETDDLRTALQPALSALPLKLSAKPMEVTVTLSPEEIPRAEDTALYVH